MAAIMSPRKKPGRKPLPSEERRTEQIRVLLTKEEKAVIEQAVERLDVPDGAAGFVRRAALQHARKVIERGS